MTDNHEASLDALMPQAMAIKAELVGEKKVALALTPQFALAVLAGAFIGLGAMFATTVGANAAGSLPYGVGRLLVGAAFSLGLILVIVGGAELFTGNTLIAMAWANRRVSTRQLLCNWVIVYLGNFVGAVGTALLVFISGQYTFGGGLVGLSALNTAHAKLQFDPLAAVALGIAGNALVCLAVWLTFSARTTTDRILAIAPPIAAFVAAGFEHSVANMYLLPIAIFIKLGAPPAFWTNIGLQPANFPDLTLDRFLFANLLPVTIGNIIGGAVLVGAVYWCIYLRHRPHNDAPDHS